MKIVRRLFVVPVGDNAHGKTTILKALVSQGGVPQFERLRKAPRVLLSPWGREIDAYIFGRSYQEVEKGHYGSVVNTLDGSDANWRERELIILPSHVDDSEDDVEEMIEAAHGAGFDIICATVIFTGHQAEDRTYYSTLWMKAWDERWTIPNPRLNPEDRNLEGQLNALGCDLWTWICRALAS